MRSLTLAAVFLAAAAALASAPAQADVYQIYNLGDGHLRDVLGITTSGTVVIFDINSGPCGGNPLISCYETWTNGVRTALTTTLPALVFDSGTNCTPTTAPALGVGNVVRARCNGALEVFGTGHLAPAPYNDSIISGPDPTTSFVIADPADSFWLNSHGDFAFTAFLNNKGADGDGLIFQAIDLTTASVPEPAGFLLLGTGALTAIGVVRRRLRK